MESGHSTEDQVTREEQEQNSLIVAYERAANALREMDPNVVCGRTGATFNDGVFCVEFLGTSRAIHMPDARFEPAEGPRIVEVLVLHYLTTTGNQSTRGDYLSFGAIPGAMFYLPSFRKRALLKLLQAFGDEPGSLGPAAATLGGGAWATGEFAWVIPVFPRIEIVCQIFPGDDEFPAEANILFPDTIVNFLPIEDIAFLGGYVTGVLIRAK